MYLCPKLKLDYMPKDATPIVQCDDWKSYIVLPVDSTKKINVAIIPIPCFLSKTHAIAFFMKYEGVDAQEAVEAKLARGAIKIGWPKLEQDQKVFYTTDGRYAVSMTSNFP